MWCIDREVKNVGIVEGKKNILEHEIWIFTKVKKERRVFHVCEGMNVL